RSTVPTTGSGTRPRPSSSSTTIRSVHPSPAPPYCSDTKLRSAPSRAPPSPAPPSLSGPRIRSPPSCAISRHRSGETPGPAASSRSARMRLNDDFPCTNSRAVRWRISCSSVRANAISSVRQAEHISGDDVELDLRGPALDRVAARAQPLAGERPLLVPEPGALPSEALRPGEHDHQLAPALVQLGAVELEDRRFGTRWLARLQASAAARQRGSEGG